MRSPDQFKRNWTFGGLLGDFPQLVDRAAINRLSEYSDGYVDCVCRDGLPQKIFDKRSGEPVGENTYYPSPEMHLITASKLLPVCRDLIAGQKNG